MKFNMTQMQQGLAVGLVALAVLCPTMATAEVVDFADVGAGLGAESQWDGKERFDATAAQDGTFTSGSLTFDNHYDEAWGPYWDGFAYSNHTYDVASPPTGFAGQYHAIPNSDPSDPDTFAVGFMGFSGRVPTIEIPDTLNIESAMITNNNYAYSSMQEGDAFAKKFGGALGEEADWLLLTIDGKDQADNATGSVEFYLADYRFSDGALDYILDDWALVDLSSLAGSRFLEFTLTSSDTGAWGMNTPGFFAVDDITLSDMAAVPEPSSLAMLFGLGGGLAFAVWRRRRQRA